MTTAPPPTSTSTAPAPTSWAGVISLSLGIFALVMAEFLPASLLPRIAEDLGVTLGSAGQAVTVTAVAAALSALFLPVLLPHADRRRVLLGLTVLAVASNLLVAAAPNLPVLLASRLLLGVALGGFWAMATAMAAQLVPADHLGRALTVINAGVSVATIAAVPLGAWLGEAWGWRGVFLLGAGAAVLALIVQVATLRPVTVASAHGLRALTTTLRSGVVAAGLFAVMLVFGGHFTGFTYIRPAAEYLSDIDGGGLAALLLVFGVANVLGTVSSGPLADRALRQAVIVFPAMLALGMFVMIATGGSIVGLFTGAALWGLGFGGTPTAVLTWGARTEPTRLEQISGLIVTVVQIAIGVGAVVGGVLVDEASASVSLFVGGIAAIIGGLLLAGLSQHNVKRTTAS